MHGAVVNGIHVTNAKVTFAARASNKSNQRSGKKFDSAAMRNKFEKQ